MLCGFFIPPIESRFSLFVKGDNALLLGQPRDYRPGRQHPKGDGCGKRVILVNGHKYKEIIPCPVWIGLNPNQPLRNKPERWL